MLMFVEASGVDAEEGARDQARNQARNGGIGEIDVHDEGSKKSQWNVPAPCAAAHVGILRLDEAIMVLIPIVHMLNYDR